MSHLKVELRSLRRSSLPRGYAFDLTRYCSVCWTKLGRVTNRGRSCPNCKRKICKVCRYWIQETKWICFTCKGQKSTLIATGYKAYSSPEEISSYRSAKTDWSKTDFLQGFQDNSETKALRSYYENVKLKSSGSPMSESSCAEDVKVNDAYPQTHSSSKMQCSKGRVECSHVFQPEKGIISHTKVDNKPSYSIDLELDLLDPVQRWLSNCYSCEISDHDDSFRHEIEHQLLMRTKFRLSNKKRLCGIIKTIPVEADMQCANQHGLECHSLPPSNGISIPTFQNDPVHILNLINVEAKKNVTKFCGFDDEKKASFTTISDTEPCIFIRNAPGKTISVRERPQRSLIPSSDYFNSRLSYKTFQRWNSFGFGHCRRPRNALPKAPNDYFDVLQSDFVECRVRRLEEDLANAENHRYVFYDDFDIQSVLSLDLDLALTDKEDYRLVYLSSSAASEDSIDDAENSLQMYKSNESLLMTGTGSIDWTFSTTSSIEDVSDASDDEATLNKYEKTIPTSFPKGEVQNSFLLENKESGSCALYPLETNILNIGKSTLDYFDEFFKFEKYTQESCFHTTINFKSSHTKTTIMQDHAAILTIKIMEGMFSIQKIPSFATTDKIIRSVYDSTKAFPLILYQKEQHLFNDMDSTGLHNSVTKPRNIYSNDKVRESSEFHDNHPKNGSQNHSSISTSGANQTMHQTEQIGSRSKEGLDFKMRKFSFPIFTYFSLNTSLMDVAHTSNEQKCLKFQPMIENMQYFLDQHLEFSSAPAFYFKDEIDKKCFISDTAITCISERDQRFTCQKNSRQYINLNMKPQIPFIGHTFPSMDVITLPWIPEAIQMHIDYFNYNNRLPHFEECLACVNGAVTSFYQLYEATQVLMLAVLEYYNIPINYTISSLNQENAVGPVSRTNCVSECIGKLVLALRYLTPTKIRDALQFLCYLIREDDISFAAAFQQRKAESWKGLILSIVFQEDVRRSHIQILDKKKWDKAPDIAVKKRKIPSLNNTNIIDCYRENEPCSYLEAVLKLFGLINTLENSLILNNFFKFMYQKYNPNEHLLTMHDNFDIEFFLRTNLTKPTIVKASIDLPFIPCLFKLEIGRKHFKFQNYHFHSESNKNLKNFKFTKFMTVSFSEKKSKRCIRYSCENDEFKPAEVHGFTENDKLNITTVNLQFMNERLFSMERKEKGCFIHEANLSQESFQVGEYLWDATSDRTLTMTSQEHSSESPENGVIDTPRTTTSKTGLSAFAVTVYRKHRLSPSPLRGQQLQVVPAVQLQCSIGRVVYYGGCWGSCTRITAKRPPYVKIATKESEESKCVSLKKSDSDNICSVLVVENFFENDVASLDKPGRNETDAVAVDNSVSTRSQRCLRSRPVVLGTGVVDANGLLLSSQKINVSLSDMDSSKTRGSKIAELKKFFDNGAEEPSFRTLHGKQNNGFNSVSDKIKNSKSECIKNVDTSSSTLYHKLSKRSYQSNIVSRNGILEDQLSQNEDVEYMGETKLNVNRELSDIPTSRGDELNSNYSSKNGIALRKHVDTCLDYENTLWDSKQLNGNTVSCTTDFDFKRSEHELHDYDSPFENGNVDEPFAKSELHSSTAELNTLIAASRAESLKQEADILPEKSTLEDYFVYAFENSKPHYNLPSDYMYPSGKHFEDNLAQNRDLMSSYSLMEEDNGCDIRHNGVSNYGCDMDEMIFDDLEDVAFSDTSSEEDLRYRPSPPNNIHSQSFSLHTIIEESCEESERDSNSATPTNQGSASKLEKYFSWDIVNNTHSDVQHREMDECSTVYSDSLSEVSNSSNDNNQDYEPSHLSSSRLETYFTTGLVGDHKYQYPDDAEFLDDVSEQCSDFDEDERCPKISRSALLSSLEISSTADTSSCIETFNQNCKFDPSGYNKSQINSSETETQEKYINSPLGSETANSKDENDGCDLEDRNMSNLEENKSLFTCVKRNLYTVCENSIDESEENELTVSKNESEPEVPVPDVQNDKTVPLLANEIIDIKQSSVAEEIIPRNSNDFIINQIISQLMEISESNNSQSQTSCNLAWQLLESEIEQLMKQVPPVTSTSCNSSTFGSSNSDYGSDTIDSGECLTTDEDDNCMESKVKKESSKCRKEKSNESEHLEFWKKVLQTLNDSSQAIYSNPNNFNHTQSYIRDHIVAFMSSLTMNSEEKPVNNDAKICDTLTKGSSNEVHNSSPNFSTNTIVIDEGISIDSTENLYSDCEAVTSVFAVEDNLSKKVEDWYNSNETALKVTKSTPELISEDPSFFQQRETVKNLPLEYNEPDINEQDTNKMSVNELVTELNDDVDELCDTTSVNDKPSLDDSMSHLSVYVDIKIGDESNIVTERHQGNEVSSEETFTESTKRSSLQLWISDEHIDLSSEQKPCVNKASSEEEKSVSLPLMSSKCFSEPNLADNDNMSDRNRISEFLENTNIVHRDTGYYSFKSSDDSILGLSESVDVQSELVPSIRRNFEESRSNSIHSSVKSNVSSKVLSNSITNIPLSSNTELKFNTLQPKPRTSKVSLNPRFSKLSHRPAVSYFSPVSVLKKLFPSKTNSPSSEISYPSKYLKKYGRSVSADDESIFGAMSMPHLNTNSSADSHIDVESERDNTLTEDEQQNRHNHSRYTQSVLSLGAHSASTTSIYSAAGGRHFGYVTISGDVLFGLNYNQKSQVMEVFVKQCRNLAAIDSKRNKSDPYVKVYLLPDKTKAGKRKTKTKRNTLNPVFNELLRFPVLKNELETRTLWLSVWNSDLFGRNDFLGEITLALGYRLLDSPTLRWYPLQERAESLSSPLSYKGEIYLALKYVPKDLSLEPCFRPAPVIAVRGALHVLVKEARNTSATVGGGTSDAFCKSYLLPDKSKSSKQKTPVVRKSRHPKWYYTMIYENLSIDELKERSLEITVWDHDKITSNDFLGAVRLNTGLGLYHGVPVDWMDAARDETSLWLAMLERPNMWVDGSLPLRPTLQSIRC